MRLGGLKGITSLLDGDPNCFRGEGTEGRFANGMWITGLTEMCIAHT